MMLWSLLFFGCPHAAGVAGEPSCPASHADASHRLPRRLGARVVGCGSGAAEVRVLSAQCAGRTCAAWIPDGDSRGVCVAASSVMVQRQTGKRVHYSEVTTVNVTTGERTVVDQMSTGGSTCVILEVR